MPGQFIYNNEALACLILAEYLSRRKSLEIASSLLVLPMLLHEPTVKKLNGRSLFRSVEEFHTSCPELIIGINQRFKEYLPITVNAIGILLEAHVIKLTDTNVEYQNHVEIETKKSGQRLDRIVSAMDKLLIMYGDNVGSSLYYKLRIQI